MSERFFLCTRARPSVRQIEVPEPHGKSNPLFSSRFFLAARAINRCFPMSFDARVVVKRLGGFVEISFEFRAQVRGSILILRAIPRSKVCACVGRHFSFFYNNNISKYTKSNFTFKFVILYNETVSGVYKNANAKLPNARNEQ